MYSPATLAVSNKHLFPEADIENAHIFVGRFSHMMSSPTIIGKTKRKLIKKKKSNVHIWFLFSYSLSYIGLKAGFEILIGIDNLLKTLIKIIV